MVGEAAGREERAVVSSALNEKGCGSVGGIPVYENGVADGNFYVEEVQVE